MKKLERETKVFMADSRAWNSTRYSYLPGGVATIIRGKPITLLQEEQVHYRKLGNFIAIKLKYQDHTLSLINIYWIPSTLP